AGYPQPNPGRTGKRIALNIIDKQRHVAVAVLALNRFVGLIPAAVDLQQLLSQSLHLLRASFHNPVCNPLCHEYTTIGQPILETREMVGCSLAAHYLTIFVFWYNRANSGRFDKSVN